MSFLPNKIVLYSVGLLGGSIGLALKKSGYKGRIVGLSSPKNLEPALKLGCIDEGYPYAAAEEVLKDADCLFLCSPINTIISTIKSLSEMVLPEGLIITDIGSTKKEITAASQSLPDTVKFIGGHPMTGSEKSGASWADPFLFENALYIITPGAEKPDEIESAFGEFLCSYLGCQLVNLDPETHDTIAATVSHVPHILAVALVEYAAEMDGKIPGTLNLAAGGFRDMTRIASSPYSVWKDILETNKAAITPVLKGFLNTLTAMVPQVQSDELNTSFDHAAQVRREIPLRNKGFITPLSEALVMASDEPGIIARMANALAENQINIKDIEVLHVREGEGGTIRVAFESAPIAESAVSILNNCGFDARIKE